MRPDRRGFGRLKTERGPLMERQTKLDPEAAALGRLYRFIHERAEYLRKKTAASAPPEENKEQKGKRQ